MVTTRSRGDALAASLRPLAGIVQFAVNPFEVAHQPLSPRRVSFATNIAGAASLLEIFEFAEQRIAARGQRPLITWFLSPSRDTEPDTDRHDGRTQAAKKRRGQFTLEDSADIAAEQHCETFPHAECDQTCISQQLIQAHNDMGIDDGDSVKKPKLQSHHNKSFKPEWKNDMDDLNKSLGI